MHKNNNMRLLYNRKLVLLLLITISFSCKSQTQKNEDFILEFEKQFFLEGTNVQTIKKYVDIHSEVVKSKNFKEMIQGLVSIGKTRKKLNENFVTKIKVISYDEAGKIEDFREDHFVRKLDYKIKLENQDKIVSIKTDDKGNFI